MDLGLTGKVALVAINVNNLEADKLPRMKERAKEKGFNYPYLYDASHPKPSYLFADGNQLEPIRIEANDLSKAIVSEKNRAHALAALRNEDRAQGTLPDREKDVGVGTAGAECGRSHTENCV